jgi:hypothetical protein
MAAESMRTGAEERFDLASQYGHDVHDLTHGPLVEQMTARIAELRNQLTETGAEAILGRTLILVQQMADATVADAHRRAELRLAEAYRQAGERLAEADREGQLRLSETDRLIAKRRADVEQQAAEYLAEAEQKAQQLLDDAQRQAEHRLAQADRLVQHQRLEGEREVAARLAEADRQVRERLTAADRQAEERLALVDRQMEERLAEADRLFGEWRAAWRSGFSDPLPRRLEIVPPVDERPGEVDMTSQAVLDEIRVEGHALADAVRRTLHDTVQIELDDALAAVGESHDRLLAMLEEQLRAGEVPHPPPA